jgi:hypothetical protein
MKTYMVVFENHAPEFVEVTDTVHGLGMAENSIRRTVAAVISDHIKEIMLVPDDFVEYRKAYQNWFFGARKISTMLALIVKGARLRAKYPGLFAAIER